MQVIQKFVFIRRYVSLKKALCTIILAALINQDTQYYQDCTRLTIKLASLFV